MSPEDAKRAELITNVITAVIDYYVAAQQQRPVSQARDALRVSIENCIDAKTLGD